MKGDDMNQTDMENLLIEAINRVQVESGRPPVHLDPDTKPLSEVPDFDSLNAVEVVMYVEQKLNRDFEINNVFMHEDRELNIREAATRLLKKARL